MKVRANLVKLAAHISALDLDGLARVCLAIPGDVLPGLDVEDGRDAVLDWRDGLLRGGMVAAKVAVSLPESGWPTEQARGFVRATLRHAELHPEVTTRVLWHAAGAHDERGGKERLDTARAVWVIGPQGVAIWGGGWREGLAGNRERDVFTATWEEVFA